MTTYTYCPQNDTVTIFYGEHLPEDMRTQVVSFESFYIRNFVVEHMHYNGRYSRMINSGEFVKAYLLCDGFGEGLPLHLASANDFDWSHVRDSSDDGLRKCAEYLVTAVKWNPGSIERMIEQHRKDIARIQESNPELEVNMLVGVAPFDDIVF